MDLVRVCIPVPQGEERVEKAPYSDKTQSMGHANVLQVAEERMPGQRTPPNLLATMTERDLLLETPAQDLEHEP